MPRTYEPIELRLKSKLKETENGCLEFQGSRNPKGYGRISLDGRLIGTHRIAYMLTFGYIPSEMMVMHKCDNPPCCNPDHLMIGTNRDNLDDMLAKGRTQRGEDKPFSKLKEADVLDIVAKHSEGQSMRSLSRAYGVCQSTIKGITIGEYWNHVTGIEG